MAEQYYIGEDKVCKKMDVVLQKCTLFVQKINSLEFSSFNSICSNVILQNNTNNNL